MSDYAPYRHIYRVSTISKVGVNKSDIFVSNILFLTHSISYKIPQTKHVFKKANVNKYWESLLRLDILQLSSLVFFNPSRFSLKQPSILWLLACSNSYKVSKSVVVARMTSGRYRSDYLSRHWTPFNRQGFCLEESCDSVRGDIVHMLITCP